MKRTLLGAAGLLGVVLPLAVNSPPSTAPTTATISLVAGGALSTPETEILGSPDGAQAIGAHLPPLLSIAVDASERLAIATTDQAAPVRTVTNGVLGTMTGTRGTLAGFDSSGALYTNPTTGLPTIGRLAAIGGGNVGVSSDIAGSQAVMVAPNHDVYGLRWADAPIELRRVGDGSAPLRSTASYVDFRGSIDDEGNVYFGGTSTIARWSPDGAVSVIAGNGQVGYSGDGGPATSAKLNYPGLVTVDDVGNVFFLDDGRIRRVSPSGIITTVAGDGSTGYSGDNGPATSAGLGYVRDLAVGPDGTLYIAATIIDGSGSRGVVRKLTFSQPPPPTTTTTTTTPPTTTAPPAALKPTDVPDRLLDTRSGNGAAAAPIEARQSIRVKVTGRGGVPADATAVALNVTVTGAQGDGFLTVWPCGAEFPTASNVNYRLGQTIPNMVISKVGEDGSVCIYADAATGVLADVAAWFGPGSPYVPLNPERILETRTDAGQIGYSGAKPAPRDTVALKVTGVGRVPVPSNASAVVLNVTGTAATAPGYVTVFPCGETMPTASNLNLQLDETRANLVVVRVPANGQVCLFTEAGAHLLADVAGYFPAGSGFTSVNPERILETRADAGQIGYSGDKPGPTAVVRLKVTGVGAANVPSSASAVVLNLTGADATAAGYVTAWPCGTDRPDASNLNLDGGSPAPNLVIAKVGSDGSVCLFTESGTHLIADLLGWFPG